MVLLAGIEYNREEEEDEQRSAGTKKPLNVIHCNETTTTASNEEKGTNKLERNVEAALMNKTKSPVGCISWFKIFLFLGESWICKMIV